MKDTILPLALWGAGSVSTLLNLPIATINQLAALTNEDSIIKLKRNLIGVPTKDGR